MGGILIENGAEQHYKSVVLTPGPEAILMLISFKIIFKQIVLLMFIHWTIFCFILLFSLSVALFYWHACCYFIVPSVVVIAFYSNIWILTAQMD